MSSTDIDDLDPFSDYGYAANRFAARATQAWLLGRGLAAETQDLQRASEAGPLPAPGLFQALRLLGDACTASCNAAGTVFVLCGEDPEVDTKLAIYRALATVHTSTLEAERWMRRIAALCGGISAHLGEPTRSSAPIGRRSSHFDQATSRCSSSMTGSGTWPPPSPSSRPSWPATSFG
jgi:hypothetical protein